MTIRETITQQFLQTVEIDKTIVVATLKFEQLDNGFDEEGDPIYLISPIIYIERNNKNL